MDGEDEGDFEGDYDEEPNASHGLRPEPAYQTPAQQENYRRMMELAAEAAGNDEDDDDDDGSKPNNSTSSVPKVGDDQSGRQHANNAFAAHGLDPQSYPPNFYQSLAAFQANNGNNGSSSFPATAASTSSASSGTSSSTTNNNSNNNNSTNGSASTQLAPASTSNGSGFGSFPSQFNIPAGTDSQELTKYLLMQAGITDLPQGLFPSNGTSDIGLGNLGLDPNLNLTSGGLPALANLQGLGNSMETIDSLNNDIQLLQQMLQQGQQQGDFLQNGGSGGGVAPTDLFSFQQQQQQLTQQQAIQLAEQARQAAEAARQQAAERAAQRRARLEEERKAKRYKPVLGYRRANCPRCKAVLSFPQISCSSLALVNCPVCTHKFALQQEVQQSWYAPDFVFEFRLQCEPWSPMQVCVFFKSLGLDHLLDSVTRNNITGKKLLELSYADIRQDMQLLQERDVRQVWGAISILKYGPEGSDIVSAMEGPNKENPLLSTLLPATEPEPEAFSLGQESIPSVHTQDPTNHES